MSFLLFLDIIRKHVPDTGESTRRKDCPKRLCYNDLNCPQRLIFSRFSVIVDNFSRCGIVVYSSFSSSEACTSAPPLDLWLRYEVRQYRVLSSIVCKPPLTLTGLTDLLLDCLPVW
jgi:hypothetical protein